jgi:hypothetical protein
MKEPLLKYDITRDVRAIQAAARRRRVLWSIGSSFLLAIVCVAFVSLLAGGTFGQLAGLAALAGWGGYAILGGPR